MAAPVASGQCLDLAVHYDDAHAGTLRVLGGGASSLCATALLASSSFDPLALRRASRGASLPVQ